MSKFDFIQSRTKCCRRATARGNVIFMQGSTSIFEQSLAKPSKVLQSMPPDTKILKTVSFWEASRFDRIRDKTSKANRSASMAVCLGGGLMARVVRGYEFSRSYVAMGEHPECLKILAAREAILIPDGLYQSSVSSEFGRTCA